MSLCVCVKACECVYLWVSDALHTLWTLPAAGQVFVHQSFSLHLENTHTNPHYERSRAGIDTHTLEADRCVSSGSERTGRERFALFLLPLLL